jgi:gluconate 2-dehydrogenase gamma chain
MLFLDLWRILNDCKFQRGHESPMKGKDTSDIGSSPTTRRRALKVMVGSAAATLGFPIVIQAAAQATSQAANAPALQKPAASYVLKYFNSLQARTVEALSEVIIPADDHSAGAGAAKVYEYIDEIVSSSPDDAKKLWTEGLAGMDRLAMGQYGQEYAKCNESQQAALMVRISRNEDQPGTPEEKFFVVLKNATIDGYYTSSIGIHQDLEYQGNTMLLEFPSCAHTEHGNG